MEQTYKNFEAIIVDDGSPDRSIDIAKEITAQDDRFRFVKKKNGGLSCARNYGVAKSRGEYISFLDSDDYFSPNFLEVMFNSIQNSGAEISVCQMHLVDESENIIETRGPKSDRVISGLEAFELNLMMTEISSGAQNKLYLRELVEKHPYPVGLLYEDRATTYKMFLDSSKVSLLTKPLFFYLQREGSIMKGISTRSISDRFTVHQSIESELKSRELLTTYRTRLNVCYILNVLIAGSYQIAKYSSDYKQDIEQIFSKFDFSSLSLSSLSLLAKYHKKKFIALILLLSSKKIFKKFCLRN